MKLTIYAIGGGALTTLGLIICDDPVDRLLSFISAATGVATLIVALYLYDEFDKKKLKFSKRLEAVENLIFEISNIHFDVYLIYSSWIQQWKTGLFLKMTPTIYYLNWHNIKRFDPDEYDKPLYFTRELVENFPKLAPNIHNAWVPSQLKEPFKALFLFSKAKPFKTLDLEGQIVVLAAKNETISSLEELFQLEYDGVHLPTGKSFFLRMKAILELYEDYFVSQLGEKPDFSEE